MTKMKPLFTVILLIACLTWAVGLTAAQDDEATEVPAPEMTEEAATDEAVDEEVIDEAVETEADLGEETDAIPESLEISDEEIEVAIEPTGDNGYCTICHDQPLRTTRLQDGSILNLYVNPAMITASVHGPTEDSPGLGCLDCHGDDVFPHNDPTPLSARTYTLDMVSLCTSCHVTQGEDLGMGLHAQAIDNGNLEAAVCTDCHGAHHIQTVENEPQLVAGVCGDCHENTLAEWQTSDHAEIGPLGCAACHNYHAQTLRAGETSTELCLTCHQDEDIMPDLHIHETHLEVDEAVPCVDCHMWRPHEQTEEGQMISILDVDNTGHSMLLDTAPCTTCHEQLSESGEWQQIISARLDNVPADPVDAGQNQLVEEEAVDDDVIEDDNTMFVLQGLLVGLGLGLTFAIVFVTRSQRRANE